jgi:predicted transcriptional regulator
MRAKKFKIRLQPMKHTLDQFKEDWKAIEKGSAPKLVAKEPVLLFSDLGMVSKVLSQERLRLIQMIREKHPASVSELAVMLGRAQANVHRDVHYLAELGILELKRIKEEGKPEAVQPEFNWSGFDIEMAS